MDTPWEQLRDLTEQHYQKNNAILNLFDSTMQENNTRALAVLRATLNPMLNQDLPLTAIKTCYHGMLLALAKKFPINARCNFSYEDITPEVAFFLSSGHQFNIQELLVHFKLRGNIFNPYTQQDFHILDLMHFLNTLHTLFPDSEQDCRALVTIIAKQHLFSLEKIIHNFAFFELLFSMVSPDSIIRQEICSYVLCHLTQTSGNHMPLFDYIYTQSNLDVNHLHRWSKEPDLGFNRAHQGGYAQDFQQHPPKGLLAVSALFGNREVMEYLLGKNASRAVYTIAGVERQVVFDLIQGEIMHNNNAVSGCGFDQIMNLLLKYDDIGPQIKIRGRTALDYAYVWTSELGPEPQIYLEDILTPNFSTTACYHVLKNYTPPTASNQTSYSCLSLWNHVKAATVEKIEEYWRMSPF